MERQRKTAKNTSHNRRAESERVKKDQRETGLERYVL